MKLKFVGACRWLSMIIVIALTVTAVGCGKKEALIPTPTPTATLAPTATVPAEPTGETGTLSNLEGDVQVLRPGASAWATATSGMKIGAGYGLKTGSTGYVLITFFDGSVMEVNAGTEISVDELSRAAGGSTTVQIHQSIGNTLNRVENLVDSSSTYEIETPAGSAVVRGTTEEVDVNQYGHTCTNIKNEGDTASHSADFTGGGVKVEIGEGQTSCCDPGGIPGAPFYSNPADDPNQYNTGDGAGGSGGSEPECAPGCTYSMVGDGICNCACYVEACNYDCIGYLPQEVGLESDYPVQFLAFVVGLEQVCDCSEYDCTPPACTPNPTPCPSPGFDWDQYGCECIGNS